MTVELSARRHGDSRNRGDSHSRREVGFIFAQYVLAAQAELSSSRPAAMALARVAAATAAAVVIWRLAATVRALGAVATAACAVM